MTSEGHELFGLEAIQWAKRRELTPLEKRAKELTKLTMRMGYPDPKVSLRAIHLMRLHLDRFEYYAVQDARVYGWSWGAIASMLGLSRQAVHRRYRNGFPNPRRRRSEVRRILRERDPYLERLPTEEWLAEEVERDDEKIIWPPEDDEDDAIYTPDGDDL